MVQVIWEQPATQALLNLPKVHWHDQAAIAKAVNEVAAGKRQAAFVSQGDKNRLVITERGVRVFMFFNRDTRTLHVLAVVRAP